MLEALNTTDLIHEWIYLHIGHIKPPIWKYDFVFEILPRDNCGLRQRMIIALPVIKTAVEFITRLGKSVNVSTTSLVRCNLVQCR